MRSRGIGRSHQKKKDIHGISVERVELHASASQTKSGHKLRGLIRLGMRDRDALPDAGRAQLFTLDQHVHRHLGVFHFAVFSQEADQLFQNSFFRRRGQLRHHRARA